MSDPFALMHTGDQSLDVRAAAEALADHLGYAPGTQYFTHIRRLST